MEKGEKDSKNNNLRALFRGRCFDCDICNGVACAGILPGMGGLGSGDTFVNNFRSWEDISVDSGDIEKIPLIGVAPMTGVSENLGGAISERSFQKALAAASDHPGFFYCGGDGHPDFKLYYSIEAGEKKPGSFFFIKPYSNDEILRRAALISGAQGVGVDIDSYNLVNLIGKARLYRKTADDLLYIAENLCDKRFVVKGICSDDQIEIIKKVRPYAVVISNHGGRVFEHGEGTAFILKRLSHKIRPYVDEIWVDGGIRNIKHIKKAGVLGADRVLIGRPFARAAVRNKGKGVSDYIEKSLSCI